MSATLKSAVVDSSALMCIAKNEPASILFLQELGQVQELFISAATHSEVLLAAMSIQESGAVDAMEQLISALKITTVDYTAPDGIGYFLSWRPESCPHVVLAETGKSAPADSGLGSHRHTRV